MRLDEIFETIMPYTWYIQNGDDTAFPCWNGGFSDIMLDIQREVDNARWSIIFSRKITVTKNGKTYTKPTVGITGGGDQYRIFSTLIAMIGEFITTVKPTEIKFSADNALQRTNDYMASDSRPKLYLTLCKKLCSQYGYSFRTIDNHVQMDFILTRI